MRIGIHLLLLIGTLVACAPAAATQTPSSTAMTQRPTTAAAPTAAVGVEAPASTALPIATSRGPGLHATDPATVSLASGGLQLIEFFRFT